MKQIVAEVVGAVKGIHDVGLMLYTGVCAVVLVDSTVGLLLRRYLIVWYNRRGAKYQSNK